MHAPEGRVVRRPRATRFPLMAIALLIAISTVRSSGDAAVSHATRRTPAAFSIAGRVRGLYPGATRPLTLTVTNPNRFSITVTSITTAVKNASSTCLAANVKVTRFSGAAIVVARRTAHVTVHVTMAHGAGNACQGAVFPFHYRGVARVRRR